MKIDKETNKARIEEIEDIAGAGQKVERKDQAQDKEKTGATAEGDQWDQEETIAKAMEGKVI